MSKIKKSIMYISIISISIILILFGILLYLKINETSNGIYFRKTYGYIGSTKSQEILLDFTIFKKGNEDISIFEEIGNIEFDDNRVLIKKSEIRSIKKHRDIEELQLSLMFQVQVYDKVQITKFRYKNNLNTVVKSYDIGLIDLENIDHENETISHGADSFFYHSNQYYFSINENNAESFIIKDLMFTNEKIKSVENIFPKNYVAGTYLEVYQKIDFEIDPYDIFMIKPIMVFNKENDSKDYYLTFAIQTKYYVRMTYKEIKEYIQHKQ